MAEHDYTRDEFFSLRFKIIEEKIDAQNKLLDKIFEQTTKTNGRVTTLEYKFNTIRLTVKLRP